LLQVTCKADFKTLQSDPRAQTQTTNPYKKGLCLQMGACIYDFRIRQSGASHQARNAAAPDSTDFRSI